MARGWLVSRSGFLVGCLLAGCGAQPLAPSVDGGRPPSVSRPPPRVVDAAPPLAAPDAAAPVSADGGTDAGPIVRLAPATVLTGADLSKAQVLAADQDGIYWVASANQLWMLPTGSDTPRQLAVDPNPPLGGGATSTCLLVRGDDVFWVAWLAQPGPVTERTPLHRTRKTGEDTVLISDFLDVSGEVAADDTYLYYSPNQGEAGIAALPLDAAPGAAPLPLVSGASGMVVGQVAVDDQHLYWTVFPALASADNPDEQVLRADKADLLAGRMNAQQLLVGDTFVLQPYGGDLYVDSEALPGSGVGRLDARGVATSLPLPTGATVLVLDDWMVSAMPGPLYPNGKIYAAPAGAVAGDGAVAVEVADDMMLLPVVGPPGLVFVDQLGHLVAISRQDLGAAVAAGQP